LPSGIAKAARDLDPQAAIDSTYRNDQTMTTPTGLVERYVAMWNDGDADSRSATVHELWAQDGAHILQPPEGMLGEAKRIGFTNPVLEARGYHALEARVTRAHQEFVAAGEFRLRPRGQAAQIGDVIKFGWEMVPAAGGDAAATGLEFLLLDAQGRTRCDYQFIER
jgi:hypothetical protein